jgi:dual specificity protein kinase YAK1
MLILARNRYLILDVLGQGTFGQVVKCQNLKTQEVVAVKVVKNRTAYFNQSMMEVSVLDLVRPSLSTAPESAKPLLAKYEARQER